MIQARSALIGISPRAPAVLRAVVYSRVSTDAQEQDGTSLDTQERACVKYAEDRGWSVVACIRDTASGATLERQGITRVRDILRRGEADRVIAYAVDRLSREQNHVGILLDELQQAGATFELVTESFENTAVGKLMLSVHAFAAEFEREKIRERTMRGKVERARSGRIPQAFGRGCFGYVYKPATGKREIELFQAEVVRRIFQRYAETRSFEMVARELNTDGIETLRGSRWSPVTIRHMLMNESYTGRMVYRRTKWTIVRGRNGAKARRRPELRPESDWIEIEGASPRIVEDVLWKRVQDILKDPERIARRPAARSYELRSRVKCGICGAAMVGQTMRSGDHTLAYYACRRAYDRFSGRDCSARYVRADRLEGGVWDEIKTVLANPMLVLQELQHAQTPKPQRDAEETGRLGREISSLQERERKLIRLFSYGEIDESLLHEEIATIKRQRTLLEGRLSSLKGPSVAAPNELDQEMLQQTAAAVGRWLENAGLGERALVLEALQITLEATVDEATLIGVLPEEPPAHLPGNMHRHDDVEVVAAAGGFEEAGAGGAGDFEGVTEGRVTELSPGQTLSPVRFALDEQVYVLDGRGLCTVWADDNSPKKTFEWQSHSLFMLPRNYKYQLTNTRGDATARLLHYNWLPMAMQTIADPKFFLENPYLDESVLYGAGDEFYSEAKVTSGTARAAWRGNFFPDMRAWDQLVPFRGRGAGGHLVSVQFPKSPMWSHMSVFPAMSYKKAHRHGPGVLIVIPAGEGFSIMWREGEEKIVIPWHEGSSFVPPNRWFHQHFNVGEAPARYLAFHSPGLLRQIGQGETIADLARDQIEYPDEDPFVRETFEAELVKRRLKSVMPEEAYKDRNFEWDYEGDD